MKTNPLKYHIVLMLKGFCMGAADVVPGVSGGTMAFILGIYRQLISAVKSFDLIFLKLLFSLKIKDAFNHVSWDFLMPIGIGILTAVFTLAKILSWLLQNKPILIWSFFFGLILASVYTIGKRFNAWSFSITIWIITGAVFTYLLVGIIPASTPNSPWFLFISGAIAICAMILPGISGSFILVLLGKYHYVLDAVNNRDFFILFLLAAGAGAGLLSFVRLLNWLFNKYPDFTIAVLTGLMLGSLRKVWPWKKTVYLLTNTGQNAALQTNCLPSAWNLETTLAVCLSITGFLSVLLLSLAAKSKNNTMGVL